MKAYAKVVGAAEEEYMPAGPPISPLTGSFFTTWAFYDLRFDGTDTIASCQIEANDVICMNPDQLDALKKLAESRMGIYEHVGTDGPHVRLRDSSPTPNPPATRPLVIVEKAANSGT